MKKVNRENPSSASSAQDITDSMTIALAFEPLKKQIDSEIKAFASAEAHIVRRLEKLASGDDTITPGHYNTDLVEQMYVVRETKRMLGSVYQDIIDRLRHGTIIELREAYALGGAEGVRRITNARLATIERYELLTRRNACHAYKAGRKCDGDALANCAEVISNSL